MKPLNIELLDEFYDRGHMNCLFGQQLKDWGQDVMNAVTRARRGGVSVDVIHDVLEDKHPEVACILTIRNHLNGVCRCPKRR